MTPRATLAVVFVLIVLLAASLLTFFAAYREHQEMKSPEVWMHEALAQCGHHAVLEFHYSASTGATWVCGK